MLGDPNGSHRQATFLPRISYFSWSEDGVGVLAGRVSKQMDCVDVENSLFLFLLFSRIEVSAIQCTFGGTFRHGCRLLEEERVDDGVCGHGDGGS